VSGWCSQVGNGARLRGSTLPNCVRVGRSVDAGPQSLTFLRWAGLRSEKFVLPLLTGRTGTGQSNRMSSKVIPPRIRLPYRYAECVPKRTQLTTPEAWFAQILRLEEAPTASPSQGGSARLKSLGPVNRAPKPIQAAGVKS
jgi:hypothetical protein